MDDSDLKSLLGTFADEYPHVLLYAAAEDSDLVLLGSDAPLVPSPTAAEGLFQWPRVGAELTAVDMGSAAAILATLLTDRDGIIELAGDTPRNTDDNMRIEYNAPLNLHRDTQTPNIPMLYGAAEVPVDAIGDDPIFFAELAEAYMANEDPDRAIESALRAGLLMPGGDPRREQHIQRAFAWYVEQRTDDPPEKVESKVLAILETEFLRGRVQPLLDGTQ
jgi:hypothetical protein